jgi:hypothetical protein
MTKHACTFLSSPVLNPPDSFLSMTDSNKLCFRLWVMAHLMHPGNAKVIRNKNMVHYEKGGSNDGTL